MSDMLLCTVAVAVSGDRRIYRLLDSLCRQTMPQGSFEVIVVENGSDLFADVRDIGFVRYFHTPVANLAAARNIALAAARGRWLLSTDADVVAEPEWIEAMVSALQQGKFTAVGGAIGKLAPANWVQRHSITIVDGQSALSYLPALPLPYVAGANAGYCTTALRAVGGFDLRFRSGSDVDICYRLGLAGHRIGIAPDALVQHEDRSSLRAHFQRFRLYSVYQVLLFSTYKKHGRQKWVINTYPIHRATDALRGLPGAITKCVRGDSAPLQRLTLQLVEAVAIWCGDIQGSIRYREVYV